MNKAKIEPIEKWNELIESDLPAKESVHALRDIYKMHPPGVAELITQSHCPNQCRHCIYPPDYHVFNKTLGPEEQIAVLEKLYKGLGLRRFVFSARSLNRDHIAVIQNFRDRFPDIRAGLIGDARTLTPIAEDVIRLAPDWLDISVDGLERDHDYQRNGAGAFQATVDILHKFKSSGVLQKINLLTCLTNLNTASVVPMMRFFNAQGFKNFLITPVTILEGIRPNSDLMPSDQHFYRFIGNLMRISEELSDAWIEIDIFDVRYVKAIQQLWPELFSEFRHRNEHLEFKVQNKESELYIKYYPASLTGMRELIVNSDGNIIPPNVMGMGDIPPEFIFGHVSDFTEKAEPFQELINRPAFSFYVSEFLHEKHL